MTNIEFKQKYIDKVKFASKETFFRIKRRKVPCFIKSFYNYYSFFLTTECNYNGKENKLYFNTHKFSKIVLLIHN